VLIVISNHLCFPLVLKSRTACHPNGCSYLAYSTTVTPTTDSPLEPIPQYLIRPGARYCPRSWWDRAMAADTSALHRK